MYRSTPEVSAYTPFHFSFTVPLSLELLMYLFTGVVFVFTKNKTIFTVAGNHEYKEKRHYKFCSVSSFVQVTLFGLTCTAKYSLICRLKFKIYIKKCYFKILEKFEMCKIVIVFFTI